MTGLIDLIKNLIKTKLIKFGSQFGKKKELIKFKNLVKLLMGFVNSITDSIEEKLSLEI
jgi:hypothetical protein